MTARDTILAKLRAACGPQPAIDGPDVGTYYGAAPEMAVDQAVARLKGNLEAAHAEVIVATAEDWSGLLARRLADGGIRRLLLNPATPEAVSLRAAAPGIEYLSFERPIEDWKRELFDAVDAGFTVMDCAVAETGALILKSGPDMPRTVSLVPPVHVALIHAAAIHPRMIDAARAGRWSAGLPANLISISGPSKTADIQQTTAYGAHGPRELIVVIVEDGQ